MALRDGAADAWDEAEGLPAEPATRRETSPIAAALARMARERGEAPGLLRELLALPEDAERREKVRRDPRFQTLGLCELVVQRGLDDGFADPRRALATAELGIELAGQLDPAYYGKVVVHDLLARAWGYLGNARRVNSDLQGAQEALTRANALLLLGSCDPLGQALILEFQTSLLATRGQYEEALPLQERALAIYEELHEPHYRGRSLIKHGILLGDLARYAEAVAATEQALTLIEPSSEPRLLLMGRHNLLIYLSESGRSAEALERLESMRRDYLEFPDAWTLLRFDWLHAKLLAQLGRQEEAAGLLERVRQGLVNSGHLSDAAWAALDLALLLLELDRPAEAAAAEMTFAVFAAVDARPPALAAALVRARAQALQDGG